MEQGRGWVLLGARMQATAARARQVAAGLPGRQAHATGLVTQAHALLSALAEVEAVTRAAWATGDPQETWANAVPCMQALGHTVLAWVWLDGACAVPEGAF